MHKNFLRLIPIIVGTFALAMPMAVCSQSWPSKPLRMIVPVPPGGANDLIARIVGAKLSEAFAQPVLIENHGGAGGTIGTAVVARASPDGYTLLMAATSHVTAPFVSKDLPYDPIKDFTPITAAAQLINCIVVHPSVPANSVKELIDYSIRNPGKVAYGTPGVGTNLHLIGELFNLATGANLLHVPYKGTAPAMSDLMGGQIQAVITSVSALPRGQVGKVRVLAVLDPTRYSGMPEVPSINETVPGFKNPGSWFGLFGPAKLPLLIVSRLNAEMAKALHSPDVQAKLDAAALRVLANSPGEFANMIKDSFDDFGKIAKVIGIKPE